MVQLYTAILTGSFSSILYVILFTVSPTLLNRRIITAPLRADVLVALGSSVSRQNYTLPLQFQMI
jgi:hypothetical protein